MTHGNAGFRQLVPAEVGSIPRVDGALAGGPVEVAGGTRRCRPCGRLLPLDAFAGDRAQPGGRMYRCRSCDAAKSAAYNATPGAVMVRWDRYDARAAVLAELGAACYGCGTDRPLSVYRDGVRLSYAALRSLADQIGRGDADELDDRSLIVSCSQCAPTSRAAAAAAVGRLLDRINGRLSGRIGTPGQTSTPRAA